MNAQRAGTRKVRDAVMAGQPRSLKDGRIAASTVHLRLPLTIIATTNAPPRFRAGLSQVQYPTRSTRGLATLTSQLERPGGKVHKAPDYYSSSRRLTRPFFYEASTWYTSELIGNGPDQIEAAPLPCKSFVSHCPHSGIDPG